MKRVKSLACFLFCITLGVSSQIIPVEKKGGHLISTWTLNEDIKARVFLETGFPIIVFDESFIKKNLKELGIKLQVPDSPQRVGMWGENETYKVSYIIKDSILINGRRIAIDAVVIDAKEVKSWKNRDIIFPLRDLNCRVELNINKGYIRLMDDLEKIPEGYVSYAANSDPATKALYMNTIMKVFDADGKSEELQGNFQLDLGAANAVYVNKNLKESSDFMARCSRMIMKDTSRIQGPKEMDLSIIMVDKIHINNIELNGEYVVAMRYAKTKNSDKYSGNIGNRFFLHFNVIFDFDKEIIFLEPTSNKVKILD